MAEILLFHHAQGLTPGCLALAEELRAAGHVVHTPDLFEGGRSPSSARAWPTSRSWGSRRSSSAAAAPPQACPRSSSTPSLSLGAMPPQLLAQTRPGALGAVLLDACVPPAELGGPWPPGLPLQIHTMDADELGDREAAEEVAATVESAELFLYPGDRHLFTDSSLPAYDAGAAALVKRRMLDFLAGLTPAGRPS